MRLWSTALGVMTLGLALTAPTAQAIGANDASNLVRAIQQKLDDFGYNAGKPDGKGGKRVVAAIRQFQTEFRLPVDGALDESTAAELEIPLYTPETEGQIFVLPDDINGISFALRGKSHAEIINFLYELSQRSASKIDTDFTKPKTVIFVLTADLKPGDVITTQFENIRLDLPKYYENFYYEIQQDTPTAPLIIINEVEAGWELQFTHRMFVNGVLVGEKRTRAAK